jgi:hypothetical protein
VDVGGRVGGVVEVIVVVGLEVKVVVGLDTAVVSVGREVSVGWGVSVGTLVLEESGVVVGRLVLACSDNFTPPSESARRKPPITITHEKKATMMPINMPVITRPWFCVLSFMCFAPPSRQPVWKRQR